MKRRVLMTSGLAFGAAMAGIRYHGDFERFAQRSRDTKEELERLDDALALFIAKCADDPAVPQFETFLDLLTDIEPDPAVCMTNAAPLLSRLGRRIAGDWGGRCSNAGC